MKIELYTEKHNIKFIDLLKRLPNGKEVFDFDKIETLFKDFNIKIIFSERGSLGKTTGLKIKALNDFEKDNRPSLFLRNSDAEIDNEKEIFLSESTCKTDKRFYNLDLISDYIINKENNKKIIKLHSVSTAHKLKGTRTQYKNIIYDEINEGIQHFRKKLNENISSLISSTNDQVKNYQKKDDTNFWLLGNMKSINHPYIIKLGITTLDKEITKYYQKIIFDDGTYKINPLCVLILSKFTEKEKNTYIKQNISTDWRLRMDLQTNEIQHTYFNETYIDEQMNVCTLTRGKTLNFIIIYEKTLLLVWKIHNTKHFYITTDEINNKDKYKRFEFFTFSKREVFENIQYFSKLKDALQNKISQNYIYYESTLARTLFITATNS